VSRVIPLLFLAACGADDPDEAAAPTDQRGPADVLEIPDTEGIDFERAYLDAMRLGLEVATARPWAGHLAAIADVDVPGACPDLYVGAPPVDDVMIDEDALGLSWYDTCATGSGLAYDGYAYWQTDVSVGPSGTVDGTTTSATRTLIADAAVLDAGGALRWEFDGEASDAIYDVVDVGYEHWTYSTLVTGTVSGPDSFTDASTTPGGYRTDLYLFASGGDVDLLEARGNTYLFTDRLHERFDSTAMDLTLIGELGAGPTDCTLEPYGWVGLRDENAFWYDLVFLPTDLLDAQEPYTNDPLSICDGCGTLYIRGVEQGQLCVDLSVLFPEIERPSVEEFVLPLHSLP
jgi:hypothetical protein